MNWIGWTMKLLCFNKLLFLLLFVTNIYANIDDKSAVVYYGSNISYPMVGSHNYIIVEPEETSTYTHGFKLYNKKIYAYISIGEIDKTNPAYKMVQKSWKAGRNKAWNSDVLDITNKDYQNFLLNELAKLKKRGFKNFFFDTLDSYEFYAKTEQQKQKARKSLVEFIKKVHKKFPNAKIILNRGFNIVDEVHNYITAILFESYYKGLDSNLNYTDVSKDDRKWLDKYLNKIKTYNLDIICVDYLPLSNIKNSEKLITKLKQKGFIPYISTKELNIYGKSSKNSIKREILTLTNNDRDKSEIAPQLIGSLVFEYLGYIQDIKQIDENSNLPTMAELTKYAGVVIWFEKGYKNPQKLLNWIKKVKKMGIKIAFASNFGVDLQDGYIDELALHVTTNDLPPSTNKIVLKDSMMGYEIQPSTNIPLYIDTNTTKPLYILKDQNNKTSILSAITPWGGYSIESSFSDEIDKDSIWTINPFLFFQEALRLKKLVVPDTTTQNGKRMFFAHLDGDGSMNRVEYNPKMFSVEVIYKDILKKYTLPQSMSFVVGEISADGLYPKLSPKLIKIARKIYELKHIEGASHTFSHPFFWDKIKNGDLDEKYRLKPKGYNFSLQEEIIGSINYLNFVIMPKNKPKKLKVKTIFWSGNCIPRANVLEYLYKNNILNINGGDTTITNIKPWQSLIAPLGMKRGEYWQIFTGQQNEDVYTHDWTKEFWAYKKVVQTFKLTNSPKRFKPINIYYHFYAGEKRASLNALKYVFDWVLKQDVFPIFTSEYIPKAMDFYDISILNENNQWIFYGMKNLHTLRVEKKNMYVKDTPNIQTTTHFLDHTYFGCNDDDIQKIYITKKQPLKPYIISTNAKILEYKSTKKTLHVKLKGYMKVKLSLNIPKKCKIKTKYVKIERKQNIYLLNFKTKEAILDVQCR